MLWKVHFSSFFILTSISHRRAKKKSSRTFAFFFRYVWNPLKFISRKNFLSFFGVKDKRKIFLVFFHTVLLIVCFHAIFEKSARNKRRKELREWWKMTLRGRKICNRRVSLFRLFWGNVSRMKELVTLALHGRSICRSEVIFISSFVRSSFKRT